MGLMEDRRADVEVICGDALDVLKDIQTSRFSWCFTSPPYGIGKSYERRVGVSEYEAWIEPITTELVRTMRDGGSIFWQVGNHVKDGVVLPLDYVFIPMFQQLGMVLRHRMFWTFGHGLHCKHRFSGRHESILWFTKGDPGIDCDAARERLMSVWPITNVKHNHREKRDHPCQFPTELVRRAIELTPLEGEGVDPFAGSGTTGEVAVEFGLPAVLIDKLPQYAEMSRNRVMPKLP